MSKDKIAQKEPSSQPINGPASDLELVRFSAKDPAEPTTGSVTTDFDLEMFRAEPGPVAIPVEGGIDAVRVVKPPKMEFIFIHPTWREYIWMILPDFKRRREAHLVLPAIAKSLPNICRRELLYPTAATMATIICGTFHRKMPPAESTSTTNPLCASWREPPINGVNSKRIWETRPTMSMKRFSNAKRRLGRLKA